jgi:hypothetical protein
MINSRLCLTSVLLCTVLGASVFAEDAMTVATILEENADALLKVLTNPTGDPGEGHVERATVFSGQQSIRIVPMQRFNNRIPGWAFPIRETPKAGEYRYLRFAWKARGGTGIMLQLHDEKDWRIRYTAGRDMYGWGTRFIAEQPPQQWSIVTVDLFANHGEQTITGIALTNFDAEAAYFDHIYFSPTIEALDRLDATGFRNQALPKLSQVQLADLMHQLSSPDAGEQYRAFWRLVASNDQTVDLLRARMKQAGAIVSAQRLAQWIGELDAESYATREAAMDYLTLHAGSARPMLERLAAGKLNEEVRWRIATLLATNTVDDREARQQANVRRLLEYIGTVESKRLLNELTTVPRP